MDKLALYDIPVPRYTSYPTVPLWDPSTHTESTWRSAVERRFISEQGEVCLYIHLPFCESLCTFCACNKRITKNHDVEEPYLLAVLAEWNMYKQMMPSTPVIREIHLGGGTPTFFSPNNLIRLIDAVTRGCIVPENHEFSVEVHPTHTSYEHLETLRNVGFNRMSLGVQDFDPSVQYIINRMQSYEQTRIVIQQARELGYQSVNVDLVYGLPLQTLDGIRGTISKIAEVMPNRIAYYSYAHVPWKSKGQRRYTDADVPSGEQKFSMYMLGREMLAGLGYASIGMDHFALPSDNLLHAYRSGALHRNFMGYTTTNHKLVIGLGVSSISDTWDTFSQNEKVVEEYQARVASGKLPIHKGHTLSYEDLVLRQHILDLMCRDHTTIKPQMLEPMLLQNIRSRLSRFEKDGLIRVTGNDIHVLDMGRLFIRNVCTAFDASQLRRQPQEQQFSQGV
ncbi:MAG TPA: oxygen-independent coproporphyrinogen III oxidase [Candidatus Didemnitutus sp.]|nr:oxygen-independent coproporphyrinogen III oxidase [Candidatus Didemnitutus sp.]